LKKIAIIFLLLTLLLSSPLLAQDYKLNVGDSISISVWGHSDLNLQTSINPNGEISFPLVGNIIAEGKTANQLQQELKNHWLSILLNPK
jgi:polysaccharide export outer membrane protein